MAGGRGSQHKLMLIERRTIALELRKQGGTYRQIADQIKQIKDDDGNLRWPKYSEAQAHRDVMAILKVLNKQAQDEAEHVKAMELERLDALWSAYFPPCDERGLCQLRPVYDPDGQAGPVSEHTGGPEDPER